MEKVLDFNDTIVKKIINRNVSRAYWLMQGNGGYRKESEKELENLHFPVSYAEFREEALLESSLIYCEAVKSYNPLYLIESGKGEDTIKFTTWLYWKLRDLDVRMWRLLSSGCKHLDSYIDAGRANSFEEEFLFRDSLSEIARDVLAAIETGQGFKIKKSREYDTATCHMGVRNFWESFIRDEGKYSFNVFLDGWNEIRKKWNEIETDSMTYLISDSPAV